MKTLPLYSILFILFILGSCTHYYYAPNIHNVPLLQNKKDARFLIAQSNGGEINSTEIQGAYAVSDKIGVTANTMFSSSKNNKDSTDRGNGGLIELGVGYFKPINTTHFIFESYLGLGGGSIHNTFQNNQTIHTSVSRFFIQPALGYSRKHIQLALSAKLCGVNLSKPTGYSNLESNQRIHLDYVGSHPFSLMFEPAFTIRAGWNNLKLQFQYGISTNLNNPELSQGESNMSLGIYFELNKSFWEKRGKIKKMKSPGGTPTF
jgi:hypothetical protein